MATDEDVVKKSPNLILMRINWIGAQITEVSTAAKNDLSYVSILTTSIDEWDIINGVFSISNIPS